MPPFHRLVLALTLSWLAPLAGLAALPAYTGPIPAPTDAYGAAGPMAVEVRTLPHPSWPGQVVTLYSPATADGPRPTWFFAHGFGGVVPELYEPLLRHWASHGWSVVFAPYPVNGNFALLYDLLDEGFVAAAAAWPERIDVSRAGFAGHSYGGGATPALALRARRERGWATQACALFILAPWFSSELTTADLTTGFPAGTQAIVQVYADDTINDHRMAIDLFRHLGVPAADKDYLLVRSDLVDGYRYRADHRVPTTPTELVNIEGRDVAFDALDAWAVHRLGQALAASAFRGDLAARAIALGGGSAAQTTMGVTPEGRALQPMEQSDAPIALFPSARYDFPFHGLLNPRRAEPPPEAPRDVPRLVNLSARARSQPFSDDVLILGAVIEGTHPKTTLLRGVGPGLVAAGVPEPMPAPELMLYRGPTFHAQVADWDADATDAALAARYAAEVGAGPLAARSRDAAFVTALGPGAITAHVSGAASGIAVVEAYEADLDTAVRFANLSARAHVGTSDRVLIVGFVVGGGPLQVLLRAVGPALEPHGIEDYLANPELTLYRGPHAIAHNDDWAVQSDVDPLVAVSAQVGASPLPAGSRDAALLLTLEPGNYSFHVRGVDGGTGVAIGELFAVPAAQP